MKGVVLAGGTGSRLRPITFSMAKQLVPVANRPILFYGLEDLAEAGIHEVGIIISPQTGDEIQAAVGSGEELGITPTFIVQDQPLGLAHALATALPFVDGDDCLMYLGDNIVKSGVADVVADFQEHRPNCQILLSPVPNPEAFGVADMAEDGSIRRLVEKPSVPPSDLALVGVYLFDATISEAVASISPSARGELEITDAIQWLIDHDRAVRASIVRDWWKDTGTKDDLLHAQELVIGGMASRIDGEVIDTRIRGAVSVGAGSRVVDCDITGPAVIGTGVSMARTTIGPQSSIGHGCRITDAAVESSIVMDQSEIHGWRLRDSLLGRGTRLHGTPPPSFVEMTLGERCEIIGE
jgi:glucose-1-phosphate thymidylyltransferase